jgi:hypothetical protein
VKAKEKKSNARENDEVINDFDFTGGVNSLAWRVMGCFAASNVLLSSTFIVLFTLLNEFLTFLQH